MIFIMMAHLMGEDTMNVGHRSPANAQSEL